MKEIMLASGRGVALVDDGDYERVAIHRWCVHIHSGRKRTIAYAQANIRIGGQWKRVMMHRFIMGLGSPRIDHKDGNGLNNTRANLRLATASNNMHNTGSRGGSSTFKGVTWHKKARKWLAQIMVNRKWHYLGVFEKEEDAARVYDAKARELHGEYAKTNFPAA
jgi:AP2 domain